MTQGYFLDTSVLFKRYIIETGSEAVNRLFDSEKEPLLFISTVTLPEVISNLRRLVDVDEVLTEEEFMALKATFLGDIGDGLLELVELTPDILLHSLEILSRQYVTPLDAIQLASALSLPEKPVFVCADQKLSRLAGEYGLPVLEPAH
ncbi:type II toxin-antitoxin system VapC family toxin [Candidatus Desulforudis audaxviator]|uniref:PilT protein domain protein n=1 Tax=Desulforudis audaxviator (strain MP104C) TaxID=477974 RepID=B1I6W3_DESAP|nr:type II toxin-antitoxin system VapC family toxin [Candidatus Desulforudis audaxviator]ACA60208.1 PilT protein domain protein [Candidatus Desulforudis audaxviator MP104C]AZK60251.1 hypothetical protein Daudx_1708 [Candidatus Desulforudis audaxviator]